MTSESPKHKGIAALFSATEVRGFLRNYLLFIGIIETIIFFVAFIAYLGPEEKTFPWRSYFFSAFIVPIGITFLLGIFVMSFNRFLFGEDFVAQEEGEGPSDPGTGKMSLRIQAFFKTTRQIPFLVLLILLGLGAGILYKIDSIIDFIARFGEKSIQYILVGIVIILGVTALFLIVWMVLKFRLQAAAMSYRQQYRSEVVKHLGFVILDDDTIVNSEGEIIQSGSGTPAETPDLLPPVIRKFGKSSKKPEKDLLLEMPEAELVSPDDETSITGKDVTN